MNSYMAREDVLAEIHRRIGGHGSAARVSRITRVSHAGVGKWLRDGIPRERVPLFSALTGLPPHVVRPDEYGPPIDAALAGAKVEAETGAHPESVTGGVAV